MAEKVYSEIRRTNVSVDGLKEETYILSPLDLAPNLLSISLTFPAFYNYQVDGDKLEAAFKKLLSTYPILLGKLKADENIRFVVKVDPSDKEKSSVPFIEAQSPLSISEAIVKHGHLTVDGYGKSEVQNLPFFIADVDFEKNIKGEEPITKLMLTHFTDGCCISLTVCHCVADGTRLGKLFKNLSMLYRGEDIELPELDRSYLWPDQLVKAFDGFGDETANAPRIAHEKWVYFYTREVAENQRMRSLYLSEETLSGIKQRIRNAGLIGENDIISSNDIVAALYCLFVSEYVAAKQPVTSVKDLDLDETFTMFAMEALANGFKCVPDNYFGNAFLPCPVFFSTEDPAVGKEPESYLEALAMLAMANRRAVQEMRSTPNMYGMLLASFYSVLADGEMVSLMPDERRRGMTTNNSGTETNLADFGEGKPVFAYMMTPLIPDGAFITPGLNFKGMTLMFLLNESIDNFISKSLVLKELAPSAIDIFEMPVDEFAQKIGLKK